MIYDCLPIQVVGVLLSGEFRRKLSNR